MKHAKLTKDRKKTLRDLYQFCIDHGMTIMDATIDFHDDNWEDNFCVTVGTAGVEVECLPKNEKPEPENPIHMFLIDKFKGEWRNKKDF